MKSPGWAVSAALLLRERGPISIHTLAERVMETGLSGLGVNNVKGEPSRTLRTQLTVKCPHTAWFSVADGQVELVDRVAAKQDLEVILVLAKLSARNPASQSDRPAPPKPEFSAAEGRELLRLHRHRERNRGLIVRKKRQVLGDDERLECEACGFDFAAVYGPRGDGFAECHHTQPISQSAPGRRTRLSDLAIVCANCHRMLHRRPWLSVPELQALVRSRRACSPHAEIGAAPDPAGDVGS